MNCVSSLAPAGRDSMFHNIIAPAERSSYDYAVNMFDATTLSSSAYDDFLTDDERDEIQKERTNHFILCVDSVLQQQNHCARIEELTSEFYLNKLQSSNLDAWIRSIVASKTKRLNIDLTPDFLCFIKFGIEPETAICISISSVRIIICRRIISYVLLSETTLRICWF